jgi:hypothetical protein
MTAPAIPVGHIERDGIRIPCASRRVFNLLLRSIDLPLQDLLWAAETLNLQVGTDLQWEAGASHEGAIPPAVKDAVRAADACAQTCRELRFAPRPATPVPAVSP